MRHLLYLDEVRLKNISKKIFEKSIDIFKKSDIIDNVKRESRMTNKNGWRPIRRMKGEKL